MNFLAASRLAGERALAERFEQAAAEGDLSVDSDTAGLARFVMMVAEANAVHAAAGVSPDELLAATDVAVLAFVGYGAGEREWHDAGARPQELRCRASA